MKFKYFLAIALMASFHFAHAVEEWILISQSMDNDIQWLVKPGSLEFEKAKDGTQIASVIGKITTASTNKVQLNKWYVSKSDCKRQMGSLVSLKINGQFQYENEFVFDSGSIASSIAKAICEAADLGKKNGNKGV